MQKTIWGDIHKVDDADDGTITVYGIASTEAIDAVGEIVKADAIRDALPEYMKFPALREMHSLSAAGSTVELEVGDDDITRIVAHVVDEAAIKKVKTKTYRGFSIGGKVLERDASNRKVITKLKLSEISLVDRPACPEATLEMWKADAESSSMDPKTEGAATPETAAAPAPDAQPAPVVVEAAKTEAEATKAEPTEGPSAPAAEVSPAEVPAAPAGEAAKAAAPAAEPEAVPAPEPDTAAKAETESAPDPLARALAAVDALEGAVTKAAGSDDLAKGLYSVRSFADALSSVAYILSDLKSEAEFEGDNSPVPAKLQSWLVAGAAIFKEMASEEVDELVARVTAQKGPSQNVSQNVR